MTAHYRQGDVLIRKLEKEVPKEGLAQIGLENGRTVLAHGEKTGHSHSFPGDNAVMFRDDAMARSVLEVRGDEPVALSHDEHAPIEVPPGDYEVVRQVETDIMEGAKEVVD